LEGLCCNAAPKPRVHTGFYNNFLSTIPLIKQHIDPLLSSSSADQPVRKLYVVGHSLGAGIATLAACYFLLEYDWNIIPHSLVGVTAGSPRTCLAQMQELVNEELAKKSEKVKMLRVVRDKDVVATVPPAILGFHHLGQLVYIAEDGTITFDASDMEEAAVDEERVKKSAAKYVLRDTDSNVDTTSSNLDKNADGEVTKYDKKVAKIPKVFRDHMPDFYLSPMKRYRLNLFPAEVETEVS
jgi:Lipase (class 3)